jgi:hypothetical protein
MTRILTREFMCNCRDSAAQGCAAIFNQIKLIENEDNQKSHLLIVVV